ncbi:YceI family protein [Fulvivirgaceae bacterium BMA10]|uniref:YceI family protein n=1 Tax=Splendidivirga corallicola TaxID=3051826 RepID=A0ABT8KQB3_9BACT|nr:YceI family protein [Fulvivirgaceae bacterium BMA10]
MNRKFVLTLVASLVLGATAFSQSTKWISEENGSHSSIGFAVDHLVISETTGEFEDYTITVLADKEDFTDAQFEFVAQVESINTKDAKRDEHLRSGDFFEASKYQTITFKGKKFKKVKDNRYKVTGDLTIKGITKTVTLDAKFGGIIKDPWGNTRAGLKVFGAIDRNDFGLKYNATLEAGGLLIGEEVRITCNVELIKQS